MNFIETQAPSNMEFGMLGEGDNFLHDGDYYIKIEEMEDINCINLGNGSHDSFGGGNLVVPCRLTATVEFL